MNFRKIANKKTICDHILAQQNATAQSIATAFGMDLRTVKRNIAWLIAHGYLAREGNHRSGRYIATNKKFNLEDYRKNGK